MEPGANPPVDVFTWLQYIPSSFAFWKRRAIDAGKTMDGTWGEARRRVEERRAKGEIIEGGADTTAAQLLTLILAFALHPEVQAKAREEIDVVCGTERSPRWDDFSKLPYINYIVKEGMRWRPVAVTALPHKVRQDDEYQGMLIPKDSTIFIPTWAIHHNENIYKDPETFDPDRYAQHPRLANDYAGSPD
ncbi:hypothetical protein NW759_001833 [Fusarium solani]|nr:hypothetical protein NW759_001833 [Fusarium solani]